MKYIIVPFLGIMVNITTWRCRHINYLAFPGQLEYPVIFERCALKHSGSYKIKSFLEEWSEIDRLLNDFGANVCERLIFISWVYYPNKDLLRMKHVRNVVRSEYTHGRIVF